MLFASLFTLAVVLPSALGTYFTGPTSSTVWSTSAGKTLTWKQQAGSPAVGTIQIRDAEGTMSQVLANSVSLLIESLSFPDGVKITSPSNSYIVEMVAATDTTYIIASVGPFKINSFGGEPAASSPRAGNPAPAVNTPAASPAPAPAASPAPAPAPTTSAAPAPAATVAPVASLSAIASARPTTIASSSRMVTVVSSSSSANVSRTSSTLSATPTAASATSGSEKLVVAIGFGIVGTLGSLML